MMSGGDDILGSFLEALNDTSDSVELTTLLTGTFARLGFPHSCYHVVRLEGSGARLPYVLHNYKDSWSEHYFREGFLEIDPVLATCPNRQLPFLWSEAIAPESLSHDQRRMFADAREAGLHDGYSVPIRGSHGEFATVTVIPEQGGDAARRLIGEQKHLVHLLALYFDRHARSPVINARLSSRRRKTVLSPREQEMLRWAALGKTSWEIAEIAGISTKSVEFHLDNAKKKLGTYSKTHAVVKALTLGLVTMDGLSEPTSRGQ
ncbi:LuxR family transcriptional regulator [Rhodospirillum rubrum]|uniref:helix-turn-helix transcriptional regulator n=1 Tax=Rhodospirillum rubrum TaxID=1085 RepID=UPI0019060304|nr:LuxR family transcriptional regulator [Rhodospirillum rubrum]MBK1665512.1 LuxR family transcriptional regulator [Rhodospirillum rubrum]MBK1677551.1 LuxR family transcriptional regulator [Rhodospirillum rubrum]